MLSYKYVVLGGGVVAGYAAQTFVHEQYDLEPHELCLISEDDTLPYDRPPLSKKFLRGETQLDDILINDTKFYRLNSIDCLLNTKVENVDIRQRQIDTSLSTTINFEKLIIATGARVRRLDLPNADLAGIHYLRQFDDSRAIRTAAEEAQHVVVIGGGYIGMEVGASLASIGLPVTMVFPEERLMQRFFTPRMSEFFQDYYEQRGVTILPQTLPVAFTGNDRVSGVILDSGQELPADLVVAGIGVEPRTELFVDTPLHINDGIIVNKHLETNMTGIYAAGDVANYYDTLFDKRRRLEHWDNAVQQARHIVHDMMSKSRNRQPYMYIPYFFSDVFDLSYEFWGDIESADEVVHRGDMESDSFSVWWLSRNRLVAGLAMNRPDAEREVIPEWIRTRPLIQPEMLADESEPLSLDMSFSIGT